MGGSFSEAQITETLHGANVWSFAHSYTFGDRPAVSLFFLNTESDTFPFWMTVNKVFALSLFLFSSHHMHKMCTDIRNVAQLKWGHIIGIRQQTDIDCSAQMAQLWPTQLLETCTVHETSMVYVLMLVDIQTHKLSMTSPVLSPTSSPSRSGGRIFFSRVNLVCWLLSSISSTPMLPQWHVRDPGHSAKSAGGRLHLNTHTPLTHGSQSGRTMPLSMQCGKISGHEFTRTLSGNTRSQWSHLTKPLLTDPGLKSGISVRNLISTLKKTPKNEHAGNELSNILQKPSHAMKKPAAAV